jgi:hypothetical protein
MILGSVWKTIYPPILFLTPNLWPSQWENDDWPSTFRGAQVSDKPIIQNGLMGCPEFPRWQMALALAKRTVGRLGRWVGHTFDLCDSFAVHNTEQQGSRAAARRFDVRTTPFSWSTLSIIHSFGFFNTLQLFVTGHVIHGFKLLVTSYWHGHPFYGLL